MDRAKLFVMLLVCWGLAGKCFAQSSWSWKRLNPFANQEPQYAEPIEITDEPPESKWQNPFAGIDLRPRPIEWRTPPFIKRMNENSARAWRTTRRNFGQWASSTGSAIRSSTYDNWEAITRGLKPKPRGGLDEQDRPAPNLGGVNEFLARPKLKF